MFSESEKSPTTEDKPGGSTLPQQQLQGSEATLAPQQLLSTATSEIWSGTLEWITRWKGDHDMDSHQFNCNVLAKIVDGKVTLKADNWPSKLTMQSMSKRMVVKIGIDFLRDARTVWFRLSGDALEDLSRAMNCCEAGCVHFTASQPNTCDIKVLILLYRPQKKAFFGIIPNDQLGFIDRLRQTARQKQLPEQPDAATQTKCDHLKSQK